MPLRALIVDDEPLARDRVRSLLKCATDVEIIGECVNGEEALAAITEQRPDLVFLDVQMPGLTGLEVLRALPDDVQPAVIFTTAHDDFALEAFEVNAADYLLKPFKPSRFETAVERARRQAASRTTGEANGRLRAWLDQKTPLPPGARRIMVRNPDRVVFVRTDEVDWIEAAGNYAILHVGKATHILRETMTHLEATLPEEIFFRASRSALVNLSRVRELHPLPGGQHVMLLHDGQKVTTTRPVRDIQERLGVL
ncbi:MAG: LytR/AlgR family response regulator transcription factor [Limisphaerales bacterium]